MSEPFETEFYGWVYGIGFQVNNTIIKDNYNQGIDYRRVHNYLKTQYDTTLRLEVFETRLRIIKAWNKLIEGEK